MLNKINVRKTLEKLWNS